MTASTAISPPVELTIRYPAGLEVELGELGLDTCTAARMEAVGPRGCAADSIMGYGSALAEVQVGQNILRESAHITLVRAPQHTGHFTLLLDAEGTEPLIARILMIGLLIPAKPPFGGALRLAIPSVASEPGGQDVALVHLNLALGPPDLFYYERLHGRTIAYRPRGIPLRGACPHGGRPFSAVVRFLDGRSASTHTTVRCHASNERDVARPSWSGPDSKPSSTLLTSGFVATSRGRPTPEKFA
jgi:hypothetical protein